MHIRPAHPSEAGIVAGLLSGAAEKLRQQGQPLWAAEHVSEDAVAPQVRRGMYHLAFDGEVPVGVFRFQLEDHAFWPDIADGTSAFVHSLAVSPHRQGQELAQVLLRHACALARQQGRGVLRLDCVSGRPKLRAIYERFGLRLHSQKTMGSCVFDRFALEL
ncbi:GNAT family N-acetyltransferase [Ramlibacter sp.]|uniref:GNAT family N-acetyltransferase n=1 Tax=Ramlibacter sp. TaxID=1917967 RepID=UPI00182E30C0|nr:GNAT family N-acetyltransferase [Ramlibacter sp.]MBA2672513.1 GNAT family N-acetyltransferase [Ramlibacter sp.]